MSEQLTEPTLNLLSIDECENYAKDHGFNSVKFMLFCNGRIIMCTWLDAYFGLFQIDSEQDNTFISTRQLKEADPEAKCMIVNDGKEEE